MNQSEPVGDRSRCDVVGLRCGHGDSIAVSPSHVQASDGTAVGALMLMQVVFGVEETRSARLRQGCCLRCR